MGLAEQIYLFNENKFSHNKIQYKDILTVSKNKKGVLDVDTVKGCTIGMIAYPHGGCYGECYAKKTADMYGIDFSKSVSRKFINRMHISVVSHLIESSNIGWYRIGVFGDPCHDWNNTIEIIETLKLTKYIPVIVTKHWISLTDEQIKRLKDLNAVINTSTSGMDSDSEIRHRIYQIYRLKSFGIKSICRVVTCRYGNTEWAKTCKEKQDFLLSLTPVIDNPLRVRKNNKHVINGDISIDYIKNSIGGGKLVSLHSDSAFLGHCKNCIDKCGVDMNLIKTTKTDEVKPMVQKKLFDDNTEHRNIEFEYVKSVIGSGYENEVAKLAVIDGIAHRAARKNMQIHSAIILKINGNVSGFFTFQNNDECKEFCLLQSTILKELFDFEIYKNMVKEVIKQNTNNYVAIITTDPKSKFETPELFEELGFKTYLKMSGFHYMVLGDESKVRHKLLAHITMTNVWVTTKSDWLKLKRDWNEKIDSAGERFGVKNPKYATREGGWQGENGFSNVVNTKRFINKSGDVEEKTKAHNSNVSVLDPVACEIILRFFMPNCGERVYNPFGGGVQFGFITGFYGYEYIASEIRKNQCDANNRICSDFKKVKWVQSDSSIYKPDGNFDLIFTCPPYYKVEKYIDYDGVIPDGEINSMKSYNEFKNALFNGYKIAIDHLKEDRFFVIMTGDSRDKNGAYYCSEAETEIFLKEYGLSIYNRIVYLESEFTRLAHAKKTLNMRKFPKREQKIIVGYKGKISNIKENFMPMGRL